MLINPLLAELTVEDLNQRYRDTWIKYDQKARLCKGFTNGESGYHIHFLAEEEDAIDARAFRWDFLDCTRPPSRWYINTYLESPIYIFYSIKRQWQRGLTGANTLFFSPKDIAIRFSRVIPEIFDSRYEDISWRSTVHIDELLGRVEKYRTWLLSPFILCFKEDDRVMFYYRNKYIGDSIGYRREIFLRDFQFQKELEECIIGTKFLKREIYEGL